MWLVTWSFNGEDLGPLGEFPTKPEAESFISRVIRVLRIVAPGTEVNFYIGEVFI